MYKKKPIDMNVNLFPSLEVSDDAQHLISAYVISTAGKNVMRMAGCMSNGILRNATKTMGAVGVIYGANEAVNTVFGVDILSMTFNAACDGVNMVRDYIDDRRMSSTGIPNPVDVTDYEQ